MSLAQLQHLSKTYALGQLRVQALTDVSLLLQPACFTVLSGPSGSGKTTLLNLIAGIDRPDQGDVCIAGQSLQQLSDNALTDFRARHIGYIFQNFNLLPVLSAFENVEYPLRLNRTPAAQRRKKVLELLDAVGLADKSQHRPNQLSGGQRQRVAIARALVHQPLLVLADEPTANLDSQTGAQIIHLMRELQRQHKTAFVFSSHDPQVIASADHLVLLKDGHLQSPQPLKEAI
ncbi:ABC transporter ATP-binding protein [Rheinheimera texasensis]|uniref:ABC transporter ATP-binding protein n=1 Tax=Rheinheimera texasensis TaxID=306205 RepID=UPI0032B236B1